ncbi:putative transcriptional regulator [Erwinia billingiae Eb661]|uniref:Putative transcriptional regulator n=1 Tax=Erwinia billingiae (strain Eb661) TaxID=634500 RepID=D8MWN1_ERWBE|nr:YtfJ family protein [Erwinia billingiae]CAX61238.1 putative transcriptional regulator [Erwinia billingiae Eb661]
MLGKLLTLVLLLLPLAASAHNFVYGQPVAPVAIADRGELILREGEFSYQNWNSGELAGKVRVVQYIAGRTSAKKKNSLLITAVKEAQFPEDRFQPTTIVNTDDAIPGSGFFVRGKIEKNKRNYPWAQFVVDSDGIGRKTWQLPEESSTILVLDREGRVRWAKDGSLSPTEVSDVIGLVQKLIGSGQS